MPDFHYWFTGTALFLACSFAFTITVGLIGIKEMISHRKFLALMAAALLLSGLAWRTAAKQEEDSAKQETRAGQLESQVGELNKTLSTISDSNKKQEEQLAKVDSQNKTLQDTLSKIASAANLNPNQSAQDLSSQIIDRLSALDKRLATVENPRRDPDALFQDKRIVARVAGIKVDQLQQMVEFQAVSSDREIDFSKEVEIQTARLMCKSASGQPGAIMASGAVRTLTYNDVSCRFLGPRIQ